MSSEIHKVYIKRVSDVLRQTGHPGLNEVLDDLREHLEELTINEGEPESLDELEERLGTPEEYAENLAPATGHRMKPLMRRRIFWIWVSVIMVMILISVTVVMNRHHIAAHYRTALGKNFDANPFFNLERMRNLKVGASASEIRDALGYPFHRRTFVGHENELDWEYTRVPNRYSPYYTRTELVTDIDEMRLIRVEINENMHMSANPDDQIINPPQSINVGTISFTRHNGQDLVVKPSDEKVYVICGGKSIESESDLSETAFKESEAFVSATWKDIPRERIRFIHIVGLAGPNHKQLYKLVKELPPDNPIYLGIVNPSVHKKLVSALHWSYTLLYSNGILYQYPPLFTGTPQIKESYREDQNWLMHRLLSQDY